MPTSGRCVRLLLGVLLAFAACATDRTVTVLSYNIHHGEGTDGVFDLPRLARVITDSGADLVALQEVDVGTRRAGGVDQAAELARLTGMQVVFGQAIAYQGGAYGDAILSRLPIRAPITWPLPAAPDHEQRVVAGALVELPDGTVVRFLGTHLDHTRDPADRVAQARALLALAFGPDELAPPTLLLGDLNAEPDSEPLRLLGTRFASAAPQGLPSFPSDAPAVAIDWVLFSPPGDWQVVEVGTLHAPAASDHAPLRAVLRLLPSR
ncbi:MAG: endonuclease/exonuclease/phosphatase family protein [Planctomycetes bacterium]|nr:endonuclease/exonuclease/phosphatase family protein [Planctomycetota bacterium]